MESAINLCPRAFGWILSQQYSVLMAPWYLSKGVVISIIGTCIRLEIYKTAIQHRIAVTLVKPHTPCQ